MPGETIRLIDPQGTIRDVPIEAAGGALDGGWKVPTSEQEIGRVAEQAREVNYGGVAGGVKAGAAALARGATLGGSDVLARALGGEDAAIALEGLRETNPGLSTGFEIGGAVLPALVSGGAALPAGAASRLGAGVARTLEARAIEIPLAEAGALGKIGAAAGGGALEGALFGAGSGVSELALSQDPLTVERIASSLSSHALYGAGVGGAAGTIGKSVELGLRRAKGAIDEALEKRAAAKARTPEEAVETGDLESVSRKKLVEMRDREIESIDKARAPQREKIVEDLHEYRDRMHEVDAFKQHHSVADGDVRELGGSLKRADRQLRNALDNKARLATQPEQALSALQQQEQAMAGMHDWALRQLRQINDQMAGLNDEVRAAIVAKQVPGEIGPFTPAGLDLAVEREAERRFQGLVTAAKRYDVIDTKFPGAIEANRQLQQQIKALAENRVSDKLNKINDALEVLSQPKQPAEVGLGAVAAAGAAIVGGPVAAAAAAGGKVLGNLKTLAAAATTRLGKAASGFLGVAAPATRYTTPLATKVLTAARFSEDDRKAKQPTKLPELYKARTDEIKSQVHIAADGSYQMRPAARQKLAAKFDGIRVADPRLADQLETAGARRIEYLASIMPRLPDYGVVQLGPERRRVDDLAMRSWARAVNALEDPAAVFERAAHGRVLPEEAKALQAVHPPLLDAFTKEVMAQLPSLKKTPHRDKRLALSILTGRPMDPALTTGVQRVIQGMYAAEPGTAGGTRAPTPQPQFGSVKADKGTQAQKRQGENT